MMTFNGIFHSEKLIRYLGVCQQVWMSWEEVHKIQNFSPQKLETILRKNGLWFQSSALLNIKYIELSSSLFLSWLHLKYQQGILRIHPQGCWDYRRSMDQSRSKQSEVGILSLLRSLASSHCFLPLMHIPPFTESAKLNSKKNLETCTVRVFF